MVELGLSAKQGTSTPYKSLDFWGNKACPSYPTNHCCDTMMSSWLYVASSHTQYLPDAGHAFPYDVQVSWQRLLGAASDFGRFDR
jgi:hypothetical protein